MNEIILNAIKKQLWITYDIYPFRQFNWEASWCPYHHWHLACFYCHMIGIYLSGFGINAWAENWMILHIFCGLPLLICGWKFYWIIYGNSTLYCSFFGGDQSVIWWYCQMDSLLFFKQIPTTFVFSFSSACFLPAQFFICNSSIVWKDSFQV